MNLITTEHVRELSTASEGSALVIAEGRAQVMPGPVTEREGYVVIGREDLDGLIGSEPLDDTALEQMAARLNSAVVEQGG